MPGGDSLAAFLAERAKMLCFTRVLRVLKVPLQFGTRAPQSASAGAAGRADASKKAMSARSTALTSSFLRRQRGTRIGLNFIDFHHFNTRFLEKSVSFHHFARNFIILTSVLQAFA